MVNDAVAHALRIDVYAELWKHPVHLLTSDEHGHDATLTVQPS
jgi:hypothetical protein